MKKIRAAINENDRVIIDIVDRHIIRYLLVETRTGKKTPLDEEIVFSLSVKKYFGCQGRTLRELYAFNDWHNKKLQIEMKRIWRAIEKKFREETKRPGKDVYEAYSNERAA